MSETSPSVGSGGSIGGDSDSSSEIMTGSNGSNNICRDFVRNVCKRTQCRFLHPENVKVRTDPIFCHDFQLGRCLRANCKFLHCMKESEEHYRKTGEIIGDLADPENKSKLKNGSGSSRVSSSRTSKVGLRSVRSEGSTDIPICKDFVKGICSRGPRGCKYRHHPPPSSNCPPPMPMAMATAYGPPVMVRSRRGVGVLMAPIIPTAGRRRELLDDVSDIYEDAPSVKRFHAMEEYFEDFEFNNEYDKLLAASSRHHPYRQRQYNHNDGHDYLSNGNNNGGSHSTFLAAPPPPQLNMGDQSQYYQQSTSSAASQEDTIKALEDENFMLKRRIEELKSSNEFLLNQNAQLRLNNTLTVGTSVAQVQPLAVSAVSVSAAPVGQMAQPIIGITSSALTGTQPLPTISISTIPTVTPVSISQPQIQSATTISAPQIFLPPQPN